MIGQIDTGKALNLSIHLTALFSIALHGEPHCSPVALLTFKYTTHIVIQEVTLYNYLYTRNA